MFKKFGIRIALFSANMEKLSIVKCATLLLFFHVGNDTCMMEMLNLFRVFNIIHISCVNANVIFPSMHAYIIVYYINDNLSSKIKDTH